MAKDRKATKIVNNLLEHFEPNTNIALNDYYSMPWASVLSV